MNKAFLKRIGDAIMNISLAIFVLAFWFAFIIFVFMGVFHFTKWILKFIL